MGKGSSVYFAQKQGMGFYKKMYCYEASVFSQKQSTMTSLLLWSGGFALSVQSLLQTGYSPFCLHPLSVGGEVDGLFWSDWSLGQFERSNPFSLFYNSLFDHLPRAGQPCQQWKTCSSNNRELWGWGEGHQTPQTQLSLSHYYPLHLEGTSLGTYFTSVYNF